MAKEETIKGGRLKRRELEQRLLGRVVRAQLEQCVVELEHEHRLPPGKSYSQKAYFYGNVSSAFLFGAAILLSRLRAWMEKMSKSARQVAKANVALTTIKSEGQ